MIDLYTWNTPNGRKVSIMLEELELPYLAIPVDITGGDQHSPEFDAMTLNHKIPVIVDHDKDVTLMESGAILLYLAEREGKLLCPPGPDRWQTLAWLMFQVAHVGPMLGQAHHFLRFNPGKAPYAEDRYGTETRRLYGVLERRLADRDFIAGEYSLVDIATWPWISRFEWQRIDFSEFPRLRDWYLRIAARPAVRRGYGVPDAAEIPLP
ncbi:MAG: glutathione S-transferase family protein [Gammaproteobacteria bacterium]|nr:glutathione S-transferase family protein [Gammaproteobacteria bacterium]